MRTFIITLILSLMMWGCFGSRTSRIDSNDGGDNEEIGNAGSGGSKVVERDARVDESSSSSGYCGDGRIQYSNNEQCDLDNLGGESCQSLTANIEAGDLSCNADCTFNTIMCYPVTSLIDGGRYDGGSVIRDAGRDARTIVIDYDDAGEDEGNRVEISGGCVRSTLSACQRDSDCRVGGCGNEICYNPDLLDVSDAPCDCQMPENLSCGCVNGGCSWWR